MSHLGGRRSLIPSLVVPDEQTWTMLGHDPADYGAVPCFRAGTTEALLLPNRIPDGLEAAMTSYLGELSGTEKVKLQDLALPGSVAVDTLLDRTDLSAATDESRSEVDDPDTDEAHDDMDDMMAIEGEPSADGLVMEMIEVTYGPVAVPFPGGLTVEATLDGEVITEVSVTGLAETPIPVSDSPAVPDPLAPIAWAAAIGIATDAVGFRTSIVPGLELERAISHLAWLRSFSRLIGWRRMTRHTAAALTELSAIDPMLSPVGENADAVNARLDAGAARVSDVLALLRDSRPLGWRLVGRGVVVPERAKDFDLDGLNARASGLRLDGRIGNPAYEELGFEPLLEREGDAAARTLLRAREAAQSIELIRGAFALEGGLSSDAVSAAGLVEGPRGVVEAERDGRNWKLTVPGAAGARSLAAEVMVGEPWADALAILASFDLSPWAAING